VYGIKEAKVEANMYLREKRKGLWVSKIYKSISRLRNFALLLRVTHLPIEGIITQEKHPPA
jgi:hypothetical protein